MTEVFDAAAMLDALRRHNVAFVVVGGVCAVLHGAPVATFDLDIVHQRTPENLARLHAALRELEARYRHPSPEPIVPQTTDLAGPGHHLLLTRAGPLDLLGAVEGNRSYEDLVGHSIEVEVAGSPLQILSLDALIELKQDGRRPRDRLMLDLLLALRPSPAPK